MTTPIDTTTNLVSYNIQREIGIALKYEHRCIMHGINTGGDLEKKISEIYQRQMQPLSEELHRYAKESLPPKPSPIYKVIAYSAALGALLTLALRQKMLCAICMIMTLWITTFNQT